MNEPKITKFFTVEKIDEANGYKITHVDQEAPVPIEEVQMLITIGLMHLLHQGMVPTSLAKIFTEARIQQEVLDSIPTDQMAQS